MVIGELYCGALLGWQMNGVAAEPIVRFASFQQRTTWLQPASPPPPPENGERR